MSNLTVRSMLLATTFALAGCGGGGGVASIPPAPVTPSPTPTPTPTPTPAFALIPGATSSQQFAVAGSTRVTSADAVPRLATADQLQVRYIASTNSYQVEIPNTQTWIDLVGKSQVEAAGGNVIVSQQVGYQYSALANWFLDGSSRGVDAYGIATPASSVPTTGSATFNGSLLGSTSEPGLTSPFVQGSITLNFNFAQGELSGSIHPFLDPEWHNYDLGTFTFRDTVYSTGSATFSGRFDTSVPGMNSFSGLFTGPNGQELIGDFAFPYKSPVDGLNYQTGGAFIAKK